MEKLATYIVREGALRARDAVGWIARLCLTLEANHASGVAHGRLSAKAIHIEAASCAARGFMLDAGDLADDPAYFSLDRATGGIRSPENDTWAVGVTLYLAVTGSLPFPGTSEEEVRARMLDAPPAPLAVFDVGDDELQLLFDQLFRKSFDERLKTLSRLRERLLDWDPSLADLPPLEYGRPEDALPRELVDEESSDDGLTSVLHKETLDRMKADVEAQRLRRQRHADPPPPPQTRDDLRPPTATLQLEAQPQAPGATQPMAFAKTLVSEPEPTVDDAPPAPPRLSGTLVMEVPAELEPAPKPPPLPPPRPAPRTVRTPLPPKLGDTMPVGMPPPFAPPVSRPLPPTLRFEDASAGVPPTDPDPAVAPPTPRAPPSPRPTPPPVTEPRPEPPSLRTPPPIPSRPPKLESPARSVPPQSGIISSDLPSALELLSGPDSIPPPEPTPAVETTRPPPPPPRRRKKSSLGVWLLFGALAGGGFAAVHFVGRSTVLRWLGIETSRPTRPTQSASAPSPSPSSSLSASPSSSLPSASTSASASPSAVVPAPVGDIRACVEPLFPEDTFAHGAPDLAFVCTETQPAKGAANLHTQVVLGGGRGGATDAMKEWATLGWYGMAVFAIARTRCCPDAPPLSTPTSLGHCKLDETLTQLGKTSLTPGSDDPAEAAMLDFTRAVNCLVRGGATELFGQEGYPKGGEVTSFKKTYLRARRLAMQK